MVLLWTILSLMLLCLVSCGSAINTSNTSGTPTSQPTLVTQSAQNKQTPTISAQATPTLSAAQATAQEAVQQKAMQDANAQRYQKTLQLNGKTLTVVVTSRVWLAFYQPQYPKQNIQISCQPTQAIDNHSLENASLPPPYYLVGYQAVEPGTCTIKNGKFILTVKVTALPN
jgi:hypothetical protein